MKLPNLVDAVLVRREKRFLSLMQFADKSQAWAHCPNPGSMKGNAIAGSRTRLIDFGADHAKQGRKLRYRWIFGKAPQSKTWVCLDTMLANSIVADALSRSKISEIPRGLVWKSEVTYKDARFDFAACEKNVTHYLEVKSVSMAEGSTAKFPDSTTLRGQKHLRTLMRAVQEGNQAYLCFLIQRADCKNFSAARDIDPVYADLLKQAHANGVIIFARSIIIDGSSVSVGKKIPIKYV